MLDFSKINAYLTNLLHKIWHKITPSEHIFLCTNCIITARSVCLTLSLITLLIPCYFLRVKYPVSLFLPLQTGRPNFEN